MITEYAANYHATRPLRTLAPEMPKGPRTVQRESVVTAIPVLTGLHHGYHRIAA